MSNPNIPPGPGRPKGLKNKKTLIMEERRAMFDEKVSQAWDKTIKELIKKDPKYIADQFIGKPTETIRHEGLEFLFDKPKENEHPDEKTAKLV